jgi:ADP-ribose pyrophosphatase
MIKILNVTKLTDYRWLNLYDVEYLTVEEKTGHWTFASRKPPQVSAFLGTLPTDARGSVPPTPPPLIADAVVIIPLLKDGRKRKLVTIKEFRIPLGDYEYGTPAGLYDHNETAENVARRELKEETGLKLTKVLYVGPACVSSAGLSDESVVYVVCECTGEVSTAGNEGTEDITVEVLDLDGVRALRQSNNKISAKTLPFLLMFDAMNKIAWPKHMKQEHPKPKKGKIVNASAVVHFAKGATFAKPEE